MFLSVQYLRGIAALLVVFVHVEFQLKRLGHEPIWPRSLEGGVDLFFVISGFVIWTAASKHSGSVLAFAYRRIARIVPLYWFITSIIVIIALVAPHILQSVSVDIVRIITSYFFIPHLAPKQDLVYPILVAGWTLNYEMFFYAIFAICLIFNENIRAFCLITILLLIVIFGFITQPQNIIIKFWSDPIILEFLYGVLIAICLKIVPKSLILSVFFLTLAVISWISFAASNLHFHRAFSLGIPAFFLVLGATTYESMYKIKQNSFAKILGDSSYALYLTHGIVLSAILQFWRLAGLDKFPIILFVFVSISFSVLVGITTYVIIDRPTQKMLRKRRIPIPNEVNTQTKISAI